MLLAALAACAGAFVQSASGFGFALVLSPALFALLEPVEAVTTLLVLGLVLNLLVLFEHWRPDHVDWRALAPMLVAAIPGLAVGAVGLTQLSKEVLQVAVGVAVIAAAGWQLRQRRQHERPRLPPAAGWAVGFTSGALTTSISVSGPPIVLWLEARGVRPEEFRASLAASFLGLNLAGCALLLAVEGGGAVEPGTVLPLLGLVVVGHALGALAFRRLLYGEHPDAPGASLRNRRERFFTVVLALVAATGVASIVAGLAG